MSKKKVVTLSEFMDEARIIASHIQNMMLSEGVTTIKAFGIPRGGITAAMAVKSFVDSGPLTMILVDDPALADIFIDDILDSGKTMSRYEKLHPATPFVALFDKACLKHKGKWLVMPYEVKENGDDESATDIITRLLEYIGEDPTREGLLETPRRMLAAWKERTSGMHVDPRSFIKVFEDGAEQTGNSWVVVNGIPVVSCCEHHGSDILGSASVGYIPSGKILGLSKLARITDAYCRRMQCQERITNQIASLLDDELKPIAVGVLIKASHACMSTRGTRIHGALTVTSALRGAALTEPDCRNEFLRLAEMGSKGPGGA